MAPGICSWTPQHPTSSFMTAICRGDERSRQSSFSCWGVRAPFGADFHLARQQAAGQKAIISTGRSRSALLRAPFNQRQKTITHGGRSLLYENVMHYVLIEPGQDEQFVTVEELQARLKAWLMRWPTNELPEDLQQFETLDEGVIYLVDSACELDLGGGLGSLQWFQVRLEA